MRKLVVTTIAAVAIGVGAAARCHRAAGCQGKCCGCPPGGDRTDTEDAAGDAEGRDG